VHMVQWHVWAVWQTSVSTTNAAVVSLWQSYMRDGLLYGVGTYLNWQTVFLNPTQSNLTISSLTGVMSTRGLQVSSFHLESEATFGPEALGYLDIRGALNRTVHEAFQITGDTINDVDSFMQVSFEAEGSFASASFHLTFKSELPFRLYCILPLGVASALDGGHAALEDMMKGTLVSELTNLHANDPPKFTVVWNDTSVSGNVLNVAIIMYVVLGFFITILSAMFVLAVFDCAKSCGIRTDRLSYYRPNPSGSRASRQLSGLSQDTAGENGVGGFVSQTTLI
jgi:hypothetical protein